METLDSARTLYDSIALWLAILPVLSIWGTILSAPATLFIVFRFWNRPTSILGRTRIRFVFAGLLALAQILGWGVGIFFLASAMVDAS
jgi:hypothetical protein